MKKEFKEQDFSKKLLSDEELAVVNLIAKKDHKLIPRWKYKIVQTGAILAIIGSVFAGIGAIATVGAKNSGINDLLDKSNPVVKRDELTNKLAVVRHDMAIGDTMVLRMSKSEYAKLTTSISVVNNKLDNVNNNVTRLTLDLKQSNEKNIDRLIDVIKNNNN